MIQLNKNAHTFALCYNLPCKWDDIQKNFEPEASVSFMMPNATRDNITCKLDNINIILVAVQDSNFVDSRFQILYLSTLMYL
jgi:hypothetical protein